VNLRNIVKVFLVNKRKNDVNLGVQNIIGYLGATSKIRAPEG